MPIDFPNTPSVNDEFQAEGRTWIWSGISWDAVIATIDAGKFITSTTPPENAQQGQGWFDPTTAQFFIYYDNVWVEVGPTLTGPAGATGPAGPEELPEQTSNEGKFLVTDGQSASWSSVISANTSATALEVRQTGSGDAFRVEDDANPDSTPFIIKSDGKVGIGVESPAAPVQLAYTAGIPDASLMTTDAFIVTAQNTAPGFSFVVSGNTSSGQRGVFKGTRSRGTLDSPTVPISNDAIISLLGAIYDGTTTRATAAIEFEVDGTVSSSVAPQRIRFLTGPTTSRIERLKIDSQGFIKFSGSLVESATISATAATGTVNYDVITNENVLFYTTAASGNWTLNVRGSSSVTLNSSIDVGQSLTLVFLVTNGATPRYPTGFQVDGANVTVRWQGGTAPSSGNANSIDAYSYTIIKTGSAAYTVLGAQTRFA
jgi:hypothetical protein